MSDEEILKLYLNRDENAIAATKEKYYHYLYKIAYQILGSHEDAEECLNDTLLALWNCDSAITGAKLKTYLIKLVRSISIDRLRVKTSQKRIPSEFICSLDEMDDMVSGGFSPEDEYEGKMLEAAIGKFVSTLSKEQRALFIGRYYYFDSLADVARYCGISEGKAKITLFRLRKKLKKYLEKEGYRL